MKTLEAYQSRALHAEQQASVKFDEVASVVAQKIGMRGIPWYNLTLYLTGIYTVVTVLTLFHRADFLNVSNYH
jgi:hypothetical protein